MPVVIPKTSSLFPATKSLVIKLAAGILLVNLFVAGLAGFSLYQSRTQYESRVTIQTQNLSQSISLIIASILDKTGVMLFSVEKEAERQIYDGGIDSISLNEFIYEQARQVPELDGLRIVNAGGEFVYGDKVVSGSPISVADRDYFMRAKSDAKAGLIISKPLLARSSHKWVFNIVRRINNPDGTFAGAVIGAVSLEYITNLFSSFGLGSHGVITLRDEELAVMVRHPEVGGVKNSIGDKVLSPALIPLLKAGRTSGSYKNPGDIDRIERTFSFNKVSTYPLYITVGLATNDYLAPWRSEAKIMLALVLLFASGSLVSAWFIYGGQKRKLIAEAELLQYRDHLEETVCQRTSELETKNEQLATEIALRKQADADLIKTAIIMNRMSDAVVWISKEGGYLYVNDAACRMYGYTREEMLSMSVSQIAPPFSSEAWQPHWEELKRNGYLHFETINKARDGHEFPVEVTANYLGIDGIENNYALVRDISDRKEAEAEKQNLLLQLSQSQKIESIGRLAGGIAHDFNNLLTPILIYAEMLKSNLSAGSDDYLRAGNIMLAADKAKVLTQQLLSFGRKQILEMRTVDMNDVIRHFYEILRRTIRESIDIRLQLTESVYGIRADRNQIEQIILNLAINAQDAINDKGVITIETALIILEDDDVPCYPGVTPGKYLLLAVSDDGGGMDQEIVDQIFEPFFTTKAVGMGSGLGLATVHGLVKQHEGHIWAFSEIGKGTVFKIYFPIVDDIPTIDAEEVSESSEVIRRDCSILLVEDNEMVRNLVCEVLDSYECRVIVAEGPKEAMEMSEGKKIDLLLTDVVMPDMNGPELYQTLVKKHQGLKVLFMSGYANSVIGNDGVLEEGINFIQKPFAVKDLAFKIETILGK